MLLLSMLLLAATQDGDPVAAVLADYHARSSAVVHCRTPQNGDEIVVCSRRKADEYRVPLVLSANAKNSVPLQTATLLDEHRPPCGEGAFMVKCGFVGATVSTDGRSIRYVPRELAP